MTADYFADLWEFGWPVRALNCFKEDGFKTLNQVLVMTDFELLRYPNFGRKTLKEVDEVIHAAGWERGIGPRQIGAFAGIISPERAKEPLERIADALERIADHLAMRERL